MVERPADQTARANARRFVARKSGERRGINSAKDLGDDFQGPHALFRRPERIRRRREKSVATKLLGLGNPEGVRPTALRLRSHQAQGQRELCLDRASRRRQLCAGLAFGASGLSGRGFPRIDDAVNRAPCSASADADEQAAVRSDFDIGRSEAELTLRRQEGADSLLQPAPSRVGARR